jgi:hypothetical protein
MRPPYSHKVVGTQAHNLLCREALRMMMFASFVQEYSQDLPGGTGVWLVCGLLLWAFVSFCFQTIANKTGTPNAWFAWIPILNIVLMLQVAKKPVWWFILFFVPLVNFIIAILMWIGVCEARGKSGLLTIALIIPGVNLFAFAYLAFSD